MSSADSLPIAAFLANQGNTALGQFSGISLGNRITGAAQGQNLFLDGNDPGGYLDDVATIAALAASTGNENGSLRRVTTLLRPFQLDLTSTATVDGTNVVATSDGVGRWLSVNVPVPHWTAQLLWDVDPVLGNDENSGIASSGFPLKTVAEFCRRMQRVGGSTYVVNILAAVPSTDRLRLSPDLGTETTGLSSSIRFKGAVSTALTGTFSATTATVAATNTQFSGTDVAVTWSAQIGQIVTMTSGGANGAVATVLKDLGAGAARFSQWTNPLTGVLSAAPAPGDTFKINTLFAFGCSISPGADPGRISILFESLGITVLGSPSSAASCQFFGCRVTVAMPAVIVGVYFYKFTACAIYFASITVFSFSDTPITVEFLACGAVNTRHEVGDLGMFNSLDSVFQGGQIRTRTSATVLRAGGIVFIRSLTGMFDAPAATPAIEIKRNGSLNVMQLAGVTGLYGSGNATYGLSVSQGGVAFIPSTMTPTLTGATADLLFEGSATALQGLELSSGGAFPTLVPLTTWANYVAAVVLNVSGFARNVMNYTTGSKIVASS